MKYYRHLAEKVDDWVRIEVEYSGGYAHQLTEQIKNSKTDEELKEVILCSILSRYMFFYTKSNKPHKISKLMIEELENMDYTLKLPSPRDSDLEKSIQYIKRNSGLYSLFYKIENLYGKEYLYEFLVYLIDEYNDFYVPNSDVLIWIKKHKDNYMKQTLPWRKEDYD
ncbi:replication initiation factor domain-containing protein [Anaerococcus provencensis]|uniref:replication initiation factor domain-containing protein n=1 Tax=Anaerococcus provencensis TaxID=938293 RepID=UPI000317F371|nr:replication initiation factor domain-containing protein [Anaerococcus provencensis]